MKLFLPSNALGTLINQIIKIAINLTLDHFILFLIANFLYRLFDQFVIILLSLALDHGLLFESGRRSNTPIFFSWKNMEFFNEFDRPWFRFIRLWVEILKISFYLLNKELVNWRNRTHVFENRKILLSVYTDFISIFIHIKKLQSLFSLLQTFKSIVTVFLKMMEVRVPSVDVHFLSQHNFSNHQYC